MMKHGEKKWVAAKVMKWCNNKQSQASCFPAGSGGGRAWGYTVMETPYDADGSVGGSKRWYLNSCTADASTCDQDENLHIHEDKYKGYQGAGACKNGNKHYGLLWNSPQNSRVCWGKESVQGATWKVYDEPISIWVG